MVVISLLTDFIIIFTTALSCMYVYMHTKVDTRHSRKFGKAYKKVDLESICFAHYIAVPSRSV